MREVKVSLAKSGWRDQAISEGFCIRADRFTEEEYQGVRDEEGKVVADLLFDNLPGSTIEAMLKRLRERYAALKAPELNPFLYSE